MATRGKFILQIRLNIEVYSEVGSKWILEWMCMSCPFSDASLKLIDHHLSPIASNCLNAPNVRMLAKAINLYFKVEIYLIKQRKNFFASLLSLKASIVADFAFEAEIKNRWSNENFLKTLWKYFCLFLNERIEFSFQID